MVRKHWLSVALVCLVAICFGHVCFADFINLDDPAFVTDNPHVLGGLTWQNVRWSFTDSVYRAGYWIPLTWISFQTDATVFGPNSAWGYHLTNLIWHIGNAVLLYLGLKRITGDYWRSAIAAALYAIHPLRVESVAWITERKDVVSGLFLLLTVGAYYYYSVRPSWRRYGLVYLCLFLGLASKPSLVTLPFAFLLLDYWPLGRLRWGQAVPSGGALPATPWYFLIVEKIPFVATSVVFSLITMHFATEIGATDISAPLQERCSVAASGYLDYLERTIWPTNLAVFYPLQTPSSGRVALAATILTAITVGLIYVARPRPALIVGWLWFLGTMFPVSGIAQTGLQATADRYTYMPHLGLTVAVVWGIAELGFWQRLSISFQKAIVGALIAVLSGLTWLQVMYWKNTELLFIHTLNVTEKNAEVHYGLSKHLFNKKKIVPAAEHALLAVEIEPRDFRFRYQYAIVLSGMGRHSDAIVQLESSAGIRSENPDVHSLLGLCLASIGRSADAKRHLQRSVELWKISSIYDPIGGDPVQRRATPHLSLGQILLLEGDVEKSLEELDQALKIKPDLAVGYQMKGIAQTRKERWAEAEHALLKAIDLDRKDVKSRGYLAMTYMRQGHRDRAAREYAGIMASMSDFLDRNEFLAIQLITSPQLRDIRMAEELALQACEASEFKDARSLNALAAVQAAKGDFSKAQATAKRALPLTTDPAVVGSLQERLRLYERGQALPMIGEDAKQR